MKKVALVAATLIAALGLTGPAAADGWGGNSPPGFPAPPRVSLFMGNDPAFAPAPPRRCAPRQRAYYGYGQAYGYAPGYGYPRYGRSQRGGGRTVIIVNR